MSNRRKKIRKCNHCEKMVTPYQTRPGGITFRKICRECRSELSRQRQLNNAVKSGKSYWNKMLEEREKVEQ